MILDSAVNRNLHSLTLAATSVSEWNGENWNGFR
jgi:hypothetical protein